MAHQSIDEARAEGHTCTVNGGMCDGSTMRCCSASTYHDGKSQRFQCFGLKNESQVILDRHIIQTNKPHSSSSKKVAVCRDRNRCIVVKSFLLEDVVQAHGNARTRDKKIPNPLIMIL